MSLMQEDCKLKIKTMDPQIWVCVLSSPSTNVLRWAAHRVKCNYAWLDFKTQQMIVFSWMLFEWWTFFSSFLNFLIFLNFTLMTDTFSWSQERLGKKKSSFVIATVCKKDEQKSTFQTDFIFLFWKLCCDLKNGSRAMKLVWKSQLNKVCTDRVKQIKIAKMEFKIMN